MRRRCAAKVARKLGIAEHKLTHVEILRRSVDARRRPIRLQLKVLAYVGSPYEETPVNLPDYRSVGGAEPIIIVGSGPAGLFAALRCLERGYMPIVLERGKDVRERIKDLRAINTKGVVNGDSNYCFGEGGAGTYSDGKLYTRSKKRGDVNAVLQILVGFGATKQILVDAHPHIGTNKLPPIIAAMRERILAQRRTDSFQHPGHRIAHRRWRHSWRQDGEWRTVEREQGDPGHGSFRPRYL